MIETPKLLIAGGGTGGHVYPGVAVGEAWQALGGRVLWAGSPRGMEARVVPALGLEFHAVEARRLKNAGPAERVANFARVPRSVWSAARLVRRLRPSAVLGVGGFVSGPVVLAAALLAVPTAIAEQNARAGLTNRLLSRVVARVYTAFPGVPGFSPAKVHVLGNPVRASIAAAGRDARPAGRGQNVLVMGGSQGAGALNARLPAVLAALRGEVGGLAVLHQAGRDREGPVVEAYRAAGFSEARVAGFIEDVPAALTWADLVICRAGATTVAELACLGRPSLLIPFPHAADDHQAANAAALVEAGAAVMLRESAMEEGALVARLRGLLADPAGLERMGASARALARPEAASAIAADLRALVDHDGEGAR